MRVGDLNHRIQIQSPIVERNNSGGVNHSTWNLEKITWGKISPITVKEQLEQKQIDASVTHTILLRYSKLEISTTWRLVYKGRIFYIKGITDKDEANDTLTATCIERTGVKKEVAVYWEDGTLAHWGNGATVFRKGE